MQRFVPRTNGTPAYRQMAHCLEQDMKQVCAAGEGMALPSENELASEFKVSRVTARQAIDELHSKELVYREQGQGTYVRSQHVTGVSGSGSFTAEVSNAGAKPGSPFVGFSRVADLPEGIWRHLTHRPDPGPGYHRLTSAQTAALLTQEAAKLPCTALSGGQFRHVPIELLRPSFQAVVFLGDLKTRDIDLALIDRIASLGGKVVVVAPRSSSPAEIANTCVFTYPDMPQPVTPIAEAIFIQLLQIPLAEARGFVAGQFTTATKVTGIL